MFKLFMSWDDEPEDETYSTEDEARAAGEEALADCAEGAEILNMSNPGDYDYDENATADDYGTYKVVDDSGDVVFDSGWQSEALPPLEEDD